MKNHSIEKDLLNPDDVSAKLVELEDRSRRNNLRIDGLGETPNETWKTCEEKVQEVLKNDLGFATEVKLLDVIELNLVISLVNIKYLPVLSFVDLISSKINNKF